ncbi:MAG: alanyl-tRNA editing protein [Caldilineaceae bacterium SB0670_bin_27]|uniref:Alanine--tRNA ligase n=1 Tax=Caldilineaceae bacterium SB0664_bin_27 TaxID=2605260 RepID=A0A6B0YWT3_9CHLR|nr:alanyl-tRNA editing protein [Caldilineaceae bacterium SB0664_bin_27]MYJ76976.1 alanyl-tRNA editing protein [Caldilineaceae bacterium SB0670_bin_27]
MDARIYYEDAYCTRFTAQVAERLTHEEQPAVRLSRSAFYPTSGGQPHDTGSLDGTTVVDVQVGADGAVLHLLAEPLPEQTTSVSGVIDWPRRYAHMQQHSGQHLLSQTFYRLLGLETVSVHFGDVLNTVDLEGPSLSVAQLADVERAANEMVWENRPVRAYWVDEEEREKVPLRRAPAVQGATRIVEIDKFDWSACGGTHVRRTGEIGLISLVRVEKHRGKSRVHFVCGGRALADAARRRGLLAETAGLLDGGVDDVPELVSKQQEALKGAERELKALQEGLVGYQARELLATAETVGGLRLVAEALNDSEPAAVQRLARALISEPGVVSLLGCAQRGKGTVVFARSADCKMHVGNLLRETLKLFGGGGGGRPDFAQGGGVAAERLGDVLGAAAEVVRREVGG